MWQLDMTIPPQNLSDLPYLVLFLFTCWLEDDIRAWGIFVRGIQIVNEDILDECTTNDYRGDVYALRLRKCSSKMKVRPKVRR